MPDEKREPRRRDAENRESREPRIAVEDESAPAPKVTARETGAKRDSFFRKRDYE